MRGRRYIEGEGESDRNRRKKEREREKERRRRRRRRRIEREMKKVGEGTENSLDVIDLCMKALLFFFEEVIPEGWRVPDALCKETVNHAGMLLESVIDEDYNSVPLSKEGYCIKNYSYFFLYSPPTPHGW